MLRLRQCAGPRRRQTCTPLVIILSILLLSFNGVVANDTTTDAPIIAPVEAPIIAPVAAPISIPVDVPEPTETPTFAPSEQPSFSPSLTPSNVPTADPTEEPTNFPTSTPSNLPSLSPSIAGSLTPSIIGSGVPSIVPTPFPTSLPSMLPTLAGSGQPSIEPSDGPTETPSFFPSNAPSIKRSGTPTFGPSFRPSAVPTIAESVRPSSGPSPGPSFEPTATFVPSVTPTSSPSVVPTATPSLAPSLSPQQYLVEVVIFFDDAQRFVGSSEITFQRITADHIFNEFLNLNGLEHPLIDLAVGTNIKTQTVETQEPEGRMLRALQSSPLKIVFDTAVSFQSLSDDLDIPVMIGGAFNTDEDRAKYLNRLQSRGDRSFSSINTVRIEINGVAQEVGTSADTDSGGKINLFVWIGAAAGGLAVLILAGLYFLRSKSPKKEVTVATSASKIHEQRLNSDILMMDAQDEISTLGDPMYAPGGMLIPGLEKDDTVAASIVSGDYDYAKNYGAADASPRTRSDTLQSSVDGSQHNNSNGDLSSFNGLGKMDNSIFSDDSSFEQQFADMEERFEVDAPSGKLGMVIDTPSGGVPVVHAIKETSVLADRVDVGDRLMSVDDEDTTGLTAMQVSKLISQKAENPSRILVFARTRARTESGDLPQ